MADNDMFVDAYHIEQGPVRMYRTDATAAVSMYPAEWSLEPWSDDAQIAWLDAKSAPASTGKASPKKPTE